MEHVHELDTKYASGTFKVNCRPRLLRGSGMLLNNKMPLTSLKVLDRVCQSMEGYNKAGSYSTGIEGGGWF